MRQHRRIRANDTRRARTREAIFFEKDGLPLSLALPAMTS